MITFEQLHALLLAAVDRDCGPAGLKQLPRQGAADAWPLVELLAIAWSGRVAVADPPGNDDRTRSLCAQVQAPDRGPSWHAIYWSSGSTGRAKAIVRGWDQALAEADAFATLVALAPGDCCCVAIAPWFGASTKAVMGALLHGASLCFESGADGDILHATPSQLQAGPWSAGGRFRLISLTGEPCPASLWPRLQALCRPGARVLNALGASETGVIANQVLPADDGWQPFAGVPQAGKGIRLLDPVGGAGCLEVRGPALAEGHLVEVDGGGWQLHSYRVPEASGGGMVVPTRDVGAWDGQGGLLLLGRADDLFKHHGCWLDPAPLVRLLASLPAVRGHVLRPTAEGGTLELWLALSPCTQASLEQVGGAILAGLDDLRLWPSQLLALPQLPCNANGKTDRAALATEACRRTALVQTVRPGTSHLAAVIVQLHAGRHHPWADHALELFALDSLDQAALLVAIQSQLGRVLDARLLAEGGTLAAVSQRLPVARCQQPESLLLWCGEGLEALQRHQPDHAALQQLVHRDWPGTSFTLAELRDQADALADSLLRQGALRPEGPVPCTLWLGGFSIQAWTAYFLGHQLLKRGVAVAGVALLCPINPDLLPLCIPVSQWGQALRRRQRQSAVRLPAWTAQSTTKLWVARSRWHKRLPRRRADHLRFRDNSTDSWLELPTSDHHNLVADPKLIALWAPQLWQQISLESGDTRLKHHPHHPLR